MKRPPAAPTARDAIQEFKPLLDQLASMMAACPLPAGERARFALYVASYFAGVAIAASGREPTPEAARDLGEAIAVALRRGMN